MGFHEGEVGGAILEAGLALIAYQGGLIAEKKQVEIVVVIVIDPDRLLEFSLGKRSFEWLEVAFVIAIELGAGRGEDAEVVHTIVIEIAGGDRDGARNSFECRYS